MHAYNCTQNDATGFSPYVLMFGREATKNNQMNKRLYDARVRNQTLEVDDRVLIRNLGITGKHKLKDRWNSLPYQVVGKFPNLPVYRVKPERGPCVVKKHRDHFLPIGYMVRLPVIGQEPTTKQRPVTQHLELKGWKSQTKAASHTVYKMFVKTGSLNQKMRIFVLCLSLHLSIQS